MQSRSFQAQTVRCSEWGEAFVSQRFRPILFLETGDFKKVEPCFYFQNIVNNFQAQPKQTSDSFCWGGGGLQSLWQMLGLLMLLSPDALILLFRDEGVNGSPPPGVGVLRNISQITQSACFRGQRAINSDNKGVVSHLFSANSYLQTSACVTSAMLICMVHMSRCITLH